MFSADGHGGDARTVLNLASHLSARHHVKVISVYRRRKSPAYRVNPRVEVSYLVDARPGQGHDEEIKTPDLQLPGRVEELLSTTLQALPAGVLISTRPSIHAAVARTGPRHLITVAQDHLNFENRSANPAVRRVLEESLPKLDCLAVLTQADATDYSTWLKGSRTLVVAIPNAVPWPVGDSAPLDSKTVVAAGRLSPQKGFARLIEAYAPIAKTQPDWQLHIYGKGPQESALRQLIEDLGAGAQVRLMGYSNQFESVLEGASIYAMSSRFEGFPMVLIEAMSKGLPLVSFDCPRGPAEIIVDGENGHLVPDGDIPGFTRAVRALIEDDSLRTRMGAAARERARQYESETIAGRWEALFEQLAARRPSS